MKKQSRFTRLFSCPGISLIKVINVKDNDTRRYIHPGSRFKSDLAQQQGDILIQPSFPRDNPVPFHQLA